MKLTYDPRYNIAYLALRDKRKQVETIRLSDEVNVDLSPDGTLYGIEFLNANEQLKGKKAKGFEVVNEATNSSRMVEIP